MLKEWPCFSSKYHSSLFAIILLLISSCRKDEETDPITASPHTGTFEVMYTRTSTTSGGPYTDEQFDMLLTINRSEDTLYLMNAYFVNEYEGQTSFKNDHTPFGPNYTLDFSENYNHVYYSITYPGEFAPSGAEFIYEGERVSVSDPENNHIFENELNGMYDLVLSHSDIVQSVDTTYASILPISLTKTPIGYTIHVDTLDFNVGHFLTFQNLNGTYIGNSTIDLNFSWENGLFQYNRTIIDPQPPYTYQEEWEITGHKL